MSPTSSSGTASFPTWLACCDAKEDLNQEEYNRAQEVKKDLEKEIQKALGTNQV